MQKKYKETFYFYPLSVTFNSSLLMCCHRCYLMTCHIKLSTRLHSLPVAWPPAKLPLGLQAMLTLVTWDCDACDSTSFCIVNTDNYCLLRQRQKIVDCWSPWHHSRLFHTVLRLQYCFRKIWATVHQQLIKFVMRLVLRLSASLSTMHLCGFSLFSSKQNHVVSERSIWTWPK